MKIHEFAPAPNARRVTIFLAEKDIKIERVHVNTRDGENLTDDFKALSVNGRIPVLELDDGTSICESVAICRYFDELYPSEHSMFGNTPYDKAHIEMWNRVVELQGYLPALQAFRNITGIYKDRERCIESWGEESKLRVIEFLPTLDKQLDLNPYIAGEHFSIADITAFVLCSFMSRIDVEVTASHPHLFEWYERMILRASTQV
ncbi:MAG: glutathione S-transferase [Aliivibrio sp.]|uniref:glutathione S-transferase family protein n=1 Tax=Aliivibrio sp. TaxID=1872443 RepID=UPI001A3992EF|nr:glutathione S-transferase [Aliivibrio sp.]